MYFAIRTRKNKKKFFSTFKENEILDDTLKKKTLIVGTLARDSQKNIPIFLKGIESISQFFEKTIIYVLENDSLDKTRQIYLEESEKRKGQKMEVWLVNEGEINLPEYKYPTFKKTTGHSHNSSRIEKMVFLRNDLLKSIRKLNDDATDKILFITDCDINMRYDDIRGIKDLLYNLVSSGEMDAIAIFGFRNYISPFDDYARGNEGFIESRINDLKLSKMKYSGLKKVKSYFGGGIFYKYSSIKDNEYELEFDKGIPMCEHTSFNKKINLFLNTNTVVDILSH